MADQSNSFLREVDSEYRRQQFLDIWQRFGILIVVAVVAIVVGTLGYVWWQKNLNASREKAGASFIAASNLATAGKADDAMKAFEAISKSGPPGYQALARLRVAGEQAKAGKVAEALAAFEAVSKDTDTDIILRDFAALQAALLRLDQADWTEMKNRLTPLVDESRPWHPSAREALGMAAYKAGKFDEAIRSFEQILGDRATPAGLAQRAQEMLALLIDKSAGAKPNGAAGGENAGKPANDSATGNAERGEGKK
ncbi:MAG: tetratricopeptide repeat protein [Hyphomicrobiaceae bacterium]